MCDGKVKTKLISVKTIEIYEHSCNKCKASWYSEKEVYTVGVKGKNSPCKLEEEHKEATSK